jgi:hypothetical protein
VNHAHWSLSLQLTFSAVSFVVVIFDSQIFTLASTRFNRWVRKARWKSALRVRSQGIKDELRLIP